MLLTRYPLTIFVDGCREEYSLCDKAIVIFIVVNLKVGFIYMYSEGYLDYGSFLSFGVHV